MSIYMFTFFDHRQQPDEDLAHEHDERDQRQLTGTLLPVQTRAHERTPDFTSACPLSDHRASRALPRRSRPAAGARDPARRARGLAGTVPRLHQPLPARMGAPGTSPIFLSGCPSTNGRTGAARPRLDFRSRRFPDFFPMVGFRSLSSGVERTASGGLAGGAGSAPFPGHHHRGGQMAQRPVA